MSDLSRREFLQGAGLGAAALVGAGGVSSLAGCAPQQSGNDAPPVDGGTDAESTGTAVPSYMNRPPIGEPEETVQADFIVCGAGGSGMAAALQANDLGLGVILLEKKAVAGGTFAFAGVHFAPNNKYALEKGKQADTLELLNTINVYNHYIPSVLLFKKFIAETSETVNWAESIGAQFTAVDFGGFDPFRGLSLLYGSGLEMGSEDGTLGGASVIAAFIEEAERRGLDIRYSTPAQELVVDASGAVTGVLATDESGKVVKFEAPAVFLATGGWGSNPDFLRELGRVNPDKVISSGYDGRDGDGVYMALKAGATLGRGYETIMFYGPHLPGATWGDNLYNGVYQPVLWVDHLGRRFMNEGGANQMEVGSAIRDLPRMFVINSQDEIDRLTAEGGIQGFDNGGGSSGQLPDFKSKLDAQIAAGNERIFVADTIEDLAAVAGIDAATLSVTVARYNEAVDKGVDEDFGKNPDFLTPITGGPFYAFECDDGFYTTVGGIRVNDDIQALNANMEPIAGLYVGGCDCSALCGDIYDFTSAPGEQSSWALNSGRMVAKQVAALLG